MTARPSPPRCGRRIGYTLTDAALAVLGPPRELADPDAAPYTLTDAGAAALATDPAGDLDHEPKPHCDGRGCRCVAGRWSR